MLTNMRDILANALKNKSAVMQFNINNLEWIKYILLTCQEANKPVILGVSESAAKYMCGYKNVYSMVTNLLDYYRISIPVSLHLDHAKTYEATKEAIDAGFTSVMIDCSSKSLDENITITKKVVDYAHRFNVLVEGEIGVIGKDSNIRLLDCLKYVKLTNVDTFAPAIGNIHGQYVGEINLNLTLLEEINKNIKLPLVLHGASGIDQTKISELINLGICKVNINTDLQIAWANGVREKINLESNIYDPRKIINFGEENIVKEIHEKLSIIGK